MFELTVNFHGIDLYVEEKKTFLSNETLTFLLNSNLPPLQTMYDTLQYHRTDLHLFYEMEEENIQNFGNRIKEVQDIFSKLDKIFSKIPLAQKCYCKEELFDQKLLHTLNNTFLIDFWEEGDYTSDSEFLKNPRNYQNKFGYIQKEEHQLLDYFVITHFQPRREVMNSTDQDMLQEIEDLNDRISNLIWQYEVFIQDLISVQELYRDLLDNYINVSNNFLSDNVLGKQFAEFLEKMDRQNSSAFLSGSSQYTHSVVGGKKKVLCKTYYFETLGAFLYFDFFNGLEGNYLPKKCENCERYFLLTGGKYSDYCEKNSPQDENKSCREVGAQAKYQNKCKTDPIWQVYNRAYKTHYARCKKKKMSEFEFGEWTVWASAFRDKMVRGEMEFEVYLEEIKR